MGKPWPQAELEPAAALSGFRGINFFVSSCDKANLTRKSAVAHRGNIQHFTETRLAFKFLNFPGEKGRERLHSQKNLINMEYPFRLAFVFLLAITLMCRSTTQVMNSHVVAYPDRTNSLRLYTDDSEPRDAIFCYIPEGRTQWRVRNHGDRLVHLRAMRGCSEIDIFRLEPNHEHDVRTVPSTENLNLQIISTSS
ncbi:hypothetical protein PGT21_023139 [Puccinia graminis f. sp. tritici]|uniref:Uncharacterized protein n=1 Tax=Puccinia graminis f. sp. tritici TaxID=56615 RepID=A0A5B0MCJ3_PUCGR|nr:hypothetical protein PGT21_023139 [Puccinia graminis f. sp. tritici]